MPPEILPDLSVVLTFLRAGQGWSQAELSRVSGIASRHINDYERGRRQLTRETLESLIVFMGLSPETIDAALACLASNRARSRTPQDSAADRSEARRRIEAVAARVGNLTAEFARSVLSLLAVEGEAMEARQRGETLWALLRRRPAAGRRLLVSKGMKYRDWGLCVRVAAESLAKAANQPQEALELAELALLIAELAPGEDAWRSRLQGYAGGHVANSRRVCNDLPEAKKALARALQLWEAGAAADPGLLNAAVVPWIEAAVRRDERRFPEALKRIDEALALDPGELKGKILLSKSAILGVLGDSAGMAAALSEAAPLIDDSREPRLACILQFNLLISLCHLERFEETGRRLPAVRALAERLGEELDLTRVAWLEGKAAAGLGHFAEAVEAFERVRRVFRQRELAYDYALVSLELALLLLEPGRTVEVRTLAEEMLWIFRAQGVAREALAALRLFCDAAKRETATAELARRVVQYLYRAQHDPELPFAAEWGRNPMRVPPTMPLENCPSPRTVRRSRPLISTHCANSGTQPPSGSSLQPAFEASVCASLCFGVQSPRGSMMQPVLDRKLTKKRQRESNWPRALRAGEFESRGGVTERASEVGTQGATSMNPKRTNTAVLRGARMTGSFSGRRVARGLHDRGTGPPLRHGALNQGEKPAVGVMLQH